MRMSLFWHNAIVRGRCINPVANGGIADVPAAAIPVRRNWQMISTLKK
jgi:hypothetical protein